MNNFAILRRAARLAAGMVLSRSSKTHQRKINYLKQMSVESLETRQYLTSTPVPFQVSSSYSIGSDPSSVVAVDLNNNGNMDAVATVSGDDAISVAMGNGRGGFSTPVEYSLGSGADPVWLATGDFNGDGKPDIVTANAGTDTISILLGNGNGTFQTPVTYSVGASPLYVLVGDFAQNGKLDIATANYAGGGSSGPVVSIFMGHGDGTFSAYTGYSFPSQFWQTGFSLAMGDFDSNNNNYPDLAVANASVDAVYMMLGNGDGTFHFSSTVLSLPENAGSIASGDFNGDGKSDLVASQTNGNALTQVYVLMGNGDGTFGTPTTYYAGRGPGSVIVADLNGDGKPDIAVTNGDQDTSYGGVAETGGVSVFLNDGTGNFSPSTAYGTGSGPVAVAAGDFNNDGALDLITADSAGNDLALNLGNGDGTFAAPRELLIQGDQNYATDVPWTITAAGDFNGDGNVDLAVGQYTDNSVSHVSVLLSNGDGTFQAPISMPVGSSVRSLAVGNFNGSEGIATANVDDNTVSVLEGWTSTGFSSTQTYNFSAAPYTVVAADMNGDGKPDLVVGFWNSATIDVLLNNGDGTFASPLVYSSYGGGESLAVADVNGDGKPDIVEASQGGAAVDVQLNEGSSGGTWQGLSAVHLYSTGGATDWPPVVGDFNGDGKQDIAVANSAGVQLLLGNGDGTFQSATTIASVPSTAQAISEADVNNDGLPDLLLANGAANSVGIILNKGLSGTTWSGFAAPFNVSSGSGVYGVTAGDFNRDGKTDLATANMTGENVTVLTQDAPPTNVSAGGPYTVNAGATITLTGAATHAGSVTYQWDTDYQAPTFNPVEVGKSVSFTAPSEPGTVTIAVLVTDLSGGMTLATATVNVVAAYAAVDPYWNFNEGTGTTAASIPTGYTQNLHGGTSWASGISGEALQLDGSTGYSSATTVLNTSSTSNYTVGAWVEWNGSGSGTIISEDRVASPSAGDGANSAFTLGVTGGHWTFTALDKNGNPVVLTSNVQAAANTWTFVAGTFTTDYGTSETAIYVNGLAQSEQEFNAATTSAAGTLVLGAGLSNGNRSNFFGGVIDDVTATPVALNQPDVVAMYQAVDLPSGFSDHDIPYSPYGSGDVPFGQAIYNPGTDTWTLTSSSQRQNSGSSANGDTTDSYGFANQLLSGDGTIAATLTSAATIDGAAPPAGVYSQSGIMFYQTTDATTSATDDDGPFVGLVMTAHVGLQLIYRSTEGQATAQVGNAKTNLSLPLDLRLARSGSTFTASYSSDGNTWTTLGSITNSGIGTTAVAGPVVSSGIAAYSSAFSTYPYTAANATFSAVSVLPGLMAAGASFDAYVNLPLAATVATFTPASTGGTFKAVIDWGDGTPTSTGYISVASLTSGGMTITGDHTYSASGNFTVTVTITYPGGIAAAVVTSYAEVESNAMDLTATATPSQGVELAWVPAGLNETGYLVQKALPGEVWTTIYSSTATEPANDTFHYDDLSGAPDTLYNYRIEATTGIEENPTVILTSNVFSATTVAAGMTAEAAPLQTLTVPLNGGPGDLSGPGTITSMVLQTGVQYEIIASGQFFIGGQYAQEAPFHADAQWAEYDSSLSPIRVSNFEGASVDLGISIDDSSLDSNKYPYWGAYNSSHVYSVIVTGTGAPLTFSFHDDYYADNVPLSGLTPLQVQIFGEQLAVTAVPVSPPPVVGQPLQNVEIATFDGGSGSSTPSDYTATIEWGDGATSDGVITADPNTAGQFIVSTSGSDGHSYSEVGNETVTITVIDSSTGASGTASESVAVVAGNDLSAPVLTAVADEGSGGIDLTWTDPDRGINGFTIQRSTDPTFPDDSTVTEGTYYDFYSDSGLSQNQIYYYRVYAVTYAGLTSPMSNTAHAELTQDQLTITSSPGSSYTLPSQSDPALGEVDVSGNDNADITDSVEFQQIQGQVNRQVAVAVPDAAGREKVDIFLLLDDTGSMANVGPELAQQFPYIIEDLRKEYPNVDFAVGVGRMGEYDAYQYVPVTYDGAFILDQPIIDLGPDDFTDPIRAETNPSPVERAIIDALNRAPLPETAGIGYGEVSAIEALYQLATGAGFDQSGDQSTTADGVAGSSAAESGTEYTDTANIPAFNSFEVGPDPVYAAPTVVSSDTNVNAVVATVKADGFAPDQYTASVEWGDGITDFYSSNPARASDTNGSQASDGGVDITESNGTIYVHVRRTLSAVGTYPVYVEIDAPNASPTSVESTIVVKQAYQVPNSNSIPWPDLTVMSPIVTGDNNFSGDVANFQFSSSTLDDYTATISWGDGESDIETACNGGIVQDSNGYHVVGQHIYSSAIATSDHATFSVELSCTNGQLNSASIPLTTNTAGSPLLPPSGTLGGAGFRVGALPIILMATDSPLVANLPVDDNQQLVTNINISGHPADSGQLTVPITDFEDGLSYNYSTANNSDGSPIITAEYEYPINAVEPPIDAMIEGGSRGATIQETIDALNALGAKVIGLGANGAYDTYPQYNQDSVTPSDQAPRSYMDAIAQLTGAYNDTPETFSNGTSDGIQPGAPLYFWITPDSSASVVSGIQSAIGATLASQQYNVSVLAPGSHILVTNNSGTQDDIAEGGSADFNLALSSESSFASSNVLFVDQSSGRLFASLPVRVDNPYKYVLTADDSQGLPVTFTLVDATAPAGSDGGVDASIDPQTQTLVWDPITAGQYSFTIEASDGNLQAFQTFTVNAAEATSNPDPSVTTVSNQTAVIGVPLSFDVSATDSNSEPLTYYLYGAPAGMTIDTSTGQAEWTASRSEIGTYQVTAVVVESDGTQGRSTFSVVATATDATDYPPVIVSQAPGNAPAGTLFKYQVLAVDADQNPIHFVVANNPDGTSQILPSGLQINLVTGDVVWTPTVEQEGPHTIYLRAVDSLGASTSFTVTINVVDAPPPPQELVLAEDPTGSTVYANWIASGDANLAGYNLYADQQADPGSPYTAGFKLNSVLLTSTTVNVTLLKPVLNLTNVSYAFWVTAVNSVGEESAPSAIAFINQSGSSYAEPRPIIISTNATQVNSTEINLFETDTAGLQADVGWTVTAAPSEAAMDDATFTDNDTTSRTVAVTVTEAGTYTFSAIATRVSPGAIPGISNPASITITVLAVPTQISVHTEGQSYESLGSGSTFNLAGSAVSTTVYDQFGNAILPTPTVTWSLLHNNSGSTLSGSVYTAGSSAEGDIIQATSGSATGYFWIFVGSSVTNNLSALAMPVAGVEGAAISSVPVAEFVDTDTAHQAGDYTATIDWGDSTGIDNNTQVVFENGAYEVLGSHNYEYDDAYGNTQAPYSITVNITLDGGTPVSVTSLATIASSASTVVTPNPSLVIYANNANQSVTFLNVQDAGSAYDKEYNAFFEWPVASSYNSSSGTYDQWSSWLPATRGPDDTTGIHFVTFGYNEPTYSEPALTNIKVLLLKDGNATDPNSGNVVDNVTIPFRIMPPLADVNPPTNVIATVLSPTSVELQWVDNGVSDFRIARIGPSQTWADPTWLVFAGEYTTSNPFYDINTEALPGNTLLAPDTTYQYEIFGSDSGGNVSNGVLSQVVTTWSTYMPANVTNATATETVASGSPGSPPTLGVQLYWDPEPTDTNIVGYDVQRQNTSTGAWVSLLGDSYVDPVGPLFNGELGYFDSTANFSSVSYYEYRIVAESNVPSGGGNAVSSGTVVTAALNTAPVSIPTGVQATSYPDGIQITWNDRPTTDDDDFGGWNVYRSDGTKFDLLNSSPITDVTGYNDLTAPFGTVIQYQVRSVSLEGVLSLPVEVDKRRSVDSEPTVPAQLTALPETIEPAGTLAIHLNWAPVVAALNDTHTLDATASYRIYRSSAEGFVPEDGTDGSVSNFIASIPATSAGSALSSFDDRTVIASTTYYYAVIAVDGNVDYSNPAYASATSGNGSSLGAPTVTSGNIGLASATLYWTAVNGAVGYEVFRQSVADGTPFELISGSSLITQLTFQDDGLSPTTEFKDQVYNYQVYAFDAQGDASSPAGTTTLTSANASSSSLTPPIVMISSPGGAGSDPLVVTSDTPVQGIVADLDNYLASWKLVLRPYSTSSNDTDDTTQSDTQDIIISQGNSQEGQLPNTSALLGAIDPASVPNGLYRLILFATDQAGNQAFPAELSAPIQIQSILKLGNLTLPFTDLTLNIPGGQSVAVTRTYDSSQADLINVGTSGFSAGYGWSFNIDGTQLRTTAKAMPGTGDYPAFSNGDLVYITLPDGDQHTFQFLATPATDDSAYAGITQSADTYVPHFVCVDGSGATLGVALENGDIPTILYQQSDGGYTDESGLNYNPADSAFGGSTPTYTLTTSDGTAYAISAVNGQMISSTTANGVFTDYTNLPYSKMTNHETGDITSMTDTATGQTVNYYYDGSRDLIGVTTPAGSETTYVYGDQLIVPYSVDTTVYAEITRPSDGLMWNFNTNSWQAYNASTPLAFQQTLTFIKDAAQQIQWYTYNAAGPNIASGTQVSISYYNQNASNALISTQTRSWAAAHMLSAIIDSRGIMVMSATYDPASGLLSSVINTDKAAAPVNTGGFNGNAGSQEVTDAAGNKTEDIYDAYGDVIREIQTMTDATGDITGYEVTVSSYTYGTEQSTDFITTGVSVYNAEVAESHYAPFEIEGADLAGLRYTEQPSGPVQQIIEYDSWRGDASQLTTDFGLGKIQEELTYSGPDGTTGNYLYNETVYSNYTKLGQPAETQTYLAAMNTGGGIISQTEVSSTLATYDTSGNLLSSTDSTGKTTYYWYSGETYSATVGTTNDPFGIVPNTGQGQGLNAGLLVYTYVKDAAGADLLLSSTTYAAATNYSAGQIADQPTATTTYDYSTSNASSGQSQTTYYYYDEMGNTVLTAVYKSWSDASGDPVYGWVASGTSYNIGGQSMSTWTATYIDNSTSPTSQPLNVTITQAAAANDSNPAIDSSASVDQPSSTTVNYLPTGSTTYNSDGQTLTTIDQYGGTTTNTYDISGNLILTQYPDGTQVRTVYDSLNRVIWQTDRFMPANSNLSSGSNVALVTHTLYNSLGQAYSTERYDNVAILIKPDPAAVLATPLDTDIYMAVAPTGLNSSSSNFISSTQTWYDDQGRTIETESASGLRTGTIYDSAGQAEYTGPLNSTAPDGGRETTVSGVATVAFLLSDFVYHTTSIGNQLGNSGSNPWSSWVFSQSTDGNGNTTLSYTDGIGDTTDQIGSVSFTVYPDGSFDQTLTSISDSPMIFDAMVNHVVPIGPSAPAGLSIPAGGHETVSIAEHRLGDALLATFDVYDAAGNLVDVYQPQLASGVTPNWHYTYDISGNETSERDPNGSVTDYFYDQNGNKVRQVMPDGTNAETWAYDQFGNVATSTDFDGNKTVNTYFTSYAPNQPAGSLEEVQYYLPPAGDGPYSPASTVQYSYTDLGLVYQVNDSAYGIATYTYDEFGNETSVATTNASNGALNDTINYVYDPKSNQLTETWTGTGSQSSATTDTAYGYNIDGQLSTVTVLRQDSANVASSPTTTYSYDFDGNIIKIAYPNGTETDYDYTQLWNAGGGIEIVTNKRITTVSGTTTTTQLSKFVYTFDAQRQKIGSVETMLDAGESASTVTTFTWVYDNDGHLTDETAVVTGDSTDSYHNHYIYDPAGNRTEEDMYAGDTDAFQSQNLYTYNADNQLTEEDDQQEGSTTTTLSNYDANGSLTETTVSSPSADTVWTYYTYDERGRMTSMTKGGVTTNYGYDTAGDKVTEGTSKYVVDDNNPTGYSQVLETWTAGKGEPDTTYEVGATIISQTGSGTGSGAGTYYLMPDGHGSTRQMTEYNTSSTSNGYVEAREDYDAFGNAITLSGITANVAGTVILYTGQMWDPDPLTYDLRYREYNPLTGRYSSMDDINLSPGDVADANKYLYAGANPVMYVDPSGHDSSIAELGVASSESASLDARIVSPVASVLRVLVRLGFLPLFYGVAKWSLSVKGMATLRKYYGTWPYPKLLTVNDTINQAQLSARGQTPKASDDANIPIYYLPADRFPDVAVHDASAILSGHPALLHYLGDSSQADVNRANAQSGYTGSPAGPTENLDEYPYAATQEGGSGASVMPLDAEENQAQGRDFGLFIRLEVIYPSEAFAVEVVPTRPWQKY